MPLACELTWALSWEAKSQSWMQVSGSLRALGSHNKPCAPISDVRKFKLIHLLAYNLSGALNSFCVHIMSLRPMMNNWKWSKCKDSRNYFPVNIQQTMETVLMILNSQFHFLVGEGSSATKLRLYYRIYIWIRMVPLGPGTVTGSSETRRRKIPSLNKGSNGSSDRRRKKSLDQSKRRPFDQSRGRPW